VAFDEGLKERTLLSADFNWPEFDQHEDLGRVKVPYHLDYAHNQPSERWSRSADATRG
jgi:hypothetical protein